MALKLRPILIEQVQRCIIQKTYYACGRNLILHDVHLGNIILGMGLPLTGADFLLSQPPCFYLTHRGTGCPAGSWLGAPPAMFHYTTTTEMRYYAELASLAANTTLNVPPAPTDRTAHTFEGGARNKLGGTERGNAFVLNCAPVAACTAHLLVLAWSRLLNRGSIPILKSASRPGTLVESDISLYEDLASLSELGSNDVFQMRTE
jgi:hypothetical protein